MRNNLKYLILCSILVLVGCKSNNKSNSESSSKSELPEPVFKNMNVNDGGHFTEAQLGYLTKEAYDDTTPYNGNMSVSAPKPVVLSWEAENASSLTLDLYEGNDRSNHLASYDVTGLSEFNFYNGKFNQSYCWSLTAPSNNKSTNTIMSDVSTFTVGIGTVAGPRNLNIEGVENFRDLGGWGYFDKDSGEYKTYIKQGMIYRSGRFNEDKKTEPVVSIKESGLKEINEVLKIKTEIDLRRTSNNEVGGLTDKSVLGNEVKYVQLPMLFGGNNILTFQGNYSGDSYEYDNPKMIKQFFELLADEFNYPIDFHCSIGKDRTGCLAYLVEALCGFDQESLYRDYMFTNFANAGMAKLDEVTASYRYGTTLAEYEGENINEKTYNYLNEVIGVEKAQLDKIIQLLKA